MSSNSPSGGMKEMVRSFSKRDSRTHWWNFTSSSSTDLLFPPMQGRDEAGRGLGSLHLEPAPTAKTTLADQCLPHTQKASLFACTKGQLLNNLLSSYLHTQPDTGMESWGLGGLCQLFSSQRAAGQDTFAKWLWAAPTRFRGST